MSSLQSQRDLRSWESSDRPCVGLVFGSDFCVLCVVGKLLRLANRWSRRAFVSANKVSRAGVQGWKCYAARRRWML